MAREAVPARGGGGASRQVRPAARGSAAVRLGPQLTIPILGSKFLLANEGLDRAEAADDLGAIMERARTWTGRAARTKAARQAGPAWLALCLACGAGDSPGGEAPADTGGEAAAGETSGAQDAQGGESAMLDIDPAALPEGATVAMVEEGKELFEGGGICYTCHMADGAGGPLAPDLTDSEWINVDGEYAAIVELVKTGVAQPLEHPGAMLPRAGMPLTDDQVAAVAAYAYMLSRF